MLKKLKYLLSLAELKDEEINLYLLLLKIKKATIMELIAGSGLNTMRVYRTILKLEERGLINSDFLNKKQKIYYPLSLESLIMTIQRKAKKLFRLEQSLKGLDPLLQFVDINAEVDNNLIEIKEGLDAFKEEYLKLPSLCKDEFLHIGSMENYWNVAGMSFESPEERYFIHQRISRGVYARVIDIKTEKMEEVGKSDSIEKRTLKLKDKLPIMENYFTIAPTHTSLFICDVENPRVIVIKQPDLLNIQREQFRSLWESA
jgi:sugar-specific transcriptional regulator TrmB